MAPLAALVVLSAVGVFATGSFAFAIFWTIKTRLEERRLKDDEADNELRTPLTATSAAPGLFSKSSTPLPPLPPLPRPATPEAEFPPPLPGDTEDQSKNSDTTRPLRAAPPPPVLLPAIIYRTLPTTQPPPTPEADSPPPLAKDFPGRALSPLLPQPPVLTPLTSLPSSSKDQPNPRSRSRSRNPNERPPLPLNKGTERPDSMHEIYDIYSKLPPTPKVVPRSAPPNVASFAQAESKWAYFGQKRAESQSRDVDVSLV